MNVRQTALACAGVFAFTACAQSSAGPGHLPSCGATRTHLSPPAGSYTSLDLASDSGCVTFAANALADTIEYLVVPWSAGGPLGGSAPFTLESAAPLAATPSFSAAAYSPIPSGRPATSRGPNAIAFDHFLRRLARSRAYATPARAAAAVGAPQPSPAGPPTVGAQRTFKVCSSMTCSAFDNVGAVARTVGAHIAIYVDTLAPSPGLSQVALDSLAAVFDSRLYPLDTATFGGVSDIDNNSVVIVLMTGTVNKLVSKTACNTDGFVAGFFFSGDIDPAFASQFNNGEIFYSIVADSAATLSCSHTPRQLEGLMPVTFVHEFQHMINFVQKVRLRGAQSEDTWLDEGLARYAEENAGRSYLADGDTASFSRFAIDPIFDAYLYMREPGASALLFAADTAGLAPLGAGWLFVRYIVDQFGDSLPHRLVESSQTGQLNVTTRTGQPFDVTVTHWALANWVSDLPGFTAPSELKYTTWHFRRTFASLHSQDPTDFPLAYPLVPPVSSEDAVLLNGTLLGGSGYYQRVTQPPGAPEFALRFADPTGSNVTASVLPRLNVVRIR